MKKTILLIATMFALATWLSGQTVITRWDFNNITPGDMNTVTPSTGAGTISLLGGVTHPSSGSSGTGSSDPTGGTNVAFQTTTYPAQGQNSATAGILVSVSTEGYENIALSFDLRLSNTSSRWVQVFYTTDGNIFQPLSPLRIGGDQDINVGELWANGLSFDFTGITEINNNPNFAVKIVSVFSPIAFTEYLSGNNYDPNTAYEAARNVSSGSQSNYGGGTWRFDMVTISGTPIPSGGAESLAIVAINNGNPVIANVPFSLTVQAVDSENVPANVDADTEVTLTLASGSGTLSGTLSGTIQAGTSSATIEGILYNVAESGVSITASATGLTSATTDQFEVLPLTYSLSLNVNIPGAGNPTGTGNYQPAQNVTVNANPNPGFTFINWTNTENTVVSTNAEYTFSMPAENVTLTANYQINTGESLIHYWHFNNLPSGTLTTVNADSTITGNAVITYPGTGSGYMDRVDPGSSLNAYLNMPAEYGLRLRNPANTREMIIAAPTTGFENIFVAFAAQRSSNGAEQQEFYYSADDGQNWTKVGEAYGISTDYTVFNFDLSNISDINNNPNLKFRILFLGPNASGTSGNQRMDNISITGTEIPAGGAESLAIIAINNGNPVIANVPFSLTVRTVDSENVPAEVDNDTEVTLTLASGSGTLSGTLTGTIQAGTSSVTIEGVVYNVAESGVSITASVTGLNPVTTQPFTVEPQTFTLALSSNIPGAGTLTGEGNYQAGEEVTVTAVANMGFTFIHWINDDNTIASTSNSYTFTMPAENLHLTAIFEQSIEIVHYWHFNTLEPAVEEVPSDYSAVGSPKITYPGTGAGYMDGRTHRAQDPVSNLNLLMGQEPNQGAVLRVRNPSNTRELIIESPTTGFENIILSFATVRTSNGAQTQTLSYSANGGTTWNEVETYDVPVLVVGETNNGWVLKQFDFSNTVEINNNPNLKFKIAFGGVNASLESGNNRFDNLSVTGYIVSANKPLPASDIRFYPNPATETLNIENLPQNATVEIYNMAGQLEISVSSSDGVIDISKLRSGMFVLRIIHQDFTVGTVFMVK